MPTWEETRATRVPTTRHVPKSARSVLARTLGTTVAEVALDPGNLLAWLRLYILPRCVLLAKPGEQGVVDVRSVFQRIRDACTWWRASKAAALWAEATAGAGVKMRGRRHKPQAPPILVENNARRTRILIEEGQLARAAPALVSLENGDGGGSAPVLGEMGLKHPRQPLPSCWRRTRPQSRCKSTPRTSTR